MIFNWTLFEDKLPVVGRSVLLRIQEGVYATGIALTRKEIICQGVVYLIESFTHWTNIPEPT